MWPSHDMRADEFADSLGGFSTGVDGGANAAYIAFDDDGDHATADLDLANESYIRGFDHGVASFDAAYIAFSFYHAD